MDALFWIGDVIVLKHGIVLILFPLLLVKNNLGMSAVVIQTQTFKDVNCDVSTRMFYKNKPKYV